MLWGWETAELQSGQTAGEPQEDESEALLVWLLNDEFTLITAQLFVCSTSSFLISLRLPVYVSLCEFQQSLKAKR